MKNSITFNHWYAQIKQQQQQQKAASSSFSNDNYVYTTTYKVFLTMERGTFNCSVSKSVSPTTLSLNSLVTTFMVDALQGGKV